MIHRENPFIRRLVALSVPRESATKLVDRFAERGLQEEVWRRWVGQVDESDFGWPEWVRSVLLMDERIPRAADRVPPDLSRLIGYVGCVAEGCRSSPVVSSLEDQVAEALENFGFADEE